MWAESLIRITLSVLTLEVQRDSDKDWDRKMASEGSLNTTDVQSTGEDIFSNVIESENDMAKGNISPAQFKIRLLWGN